mmetsp:Transcript_3401/g.9512  ORF Transcript_3401/g.9512 Transcript_3401/m.9512 type:complete len:350 (+) Transcript_3401:1900-2949(+)
MAHKLGSLLGQTFRRGAFSFHRRVLGESVSTSARTASASFSTKLDEPGKLVSGLTLEEVEANPEISDFLRSNFGDDEDEDRDIISGISIPPEVLREFGFEDEIYEDDVPASKYGELRVDAGLGNAEQQSLNIRVLKTYLRSEEGSRACRRLRNNSIIPGVLFGSDPESKILSSDSSSTTLLKTPWPELQRELDRYHRQFESRVYDLTVLEHEEDTEGTVHRVVPSSVQWHPVAGSIFCANFVRYHPGRPLNIPLRYINEEESPALKRDGYIIPVRKYVPCFVEEGVAIPDFLDLECTGLHVKDIIRMDRVIFPDGVRAIDRLDFKNFVIGPVRGGRGAATVTDDSESEN